MTAQKNHILIAEKDECLMRTMTLMLQGERYRVIQAKDCHEAWNKLQHPEALEVDHIDMVIVDASRSRPASFRFVNYVSKTPICVPILILIEYGEEMLLDLSGLKTRAKYLCKPFEATELLESVKSLLDANPACVPY